MKEDKRRLFLDQIEIEKKLPNFQKYQQMIDLFSRLPLFQSFNFKTEEHANLHYQNEPTLQLQPPSFGEPKSFVNCVLKALSPTIDLKQDSSVSLVSSPNLPRHLFICMSAVRNLNSGQRAPETQLYADLLLNDDDVGNAQIDLVDMSDYGDIPEVLCLGKINLAQPDQVQEVRSFVLGTVAMHMEFRSDTDGRNMVPTRPFMQAFMQTAKEGLDHLVMMNVASNQVCAEQLKDAYAESDDVFDLRGTMEVLQDPARLVTDEALAGRSFNHTERQRELHKVQKKIC